MSRHRIGLILIMFCIGLIFSFFVLKSGDGLPYYDIPVRGDSENGYFIVAEVGTPPQPINLLLDTGSSNVAVAGAPQKFTKIKYFVFNDSQTFRPTNEKIHLRYVLGDWEGFLGTDILNPCLMANCSILCSIGCMTSMNDIFDEDSLFQGIVGLAYSSLSKPNPSIHSFLDIFIRTYGTKNMFALDLAGPFFSSGSISKLPGNFRIGFSDKDLPDSFTYTPIVHDWYYEVTVVNLKIGAKSAPISCQDVNRNKSIIDSGTTELLVPADLYSFIVSEIMNYPKISSWRKFWVNQTLCLGSKPFDTSLFPPIDMSLYHSKNSFFDLHISPELYLLPTSNSSCARLGIRPSSFGVVIGSSVLKGYHVLFDREKSRIGFSKSSSWSSQNRVVSDVLNNNNADFDQCIRDELPNDSSISPLVIILLIGICIFAIIFLYALLSWIWKYYHILGGENRSGRSSLIEDDD